MVVSRARLFGRGHLLAIVAHNPRNLEKTFNNFSLRHWEFAWHCSQKWFTNERLLNHSIHDVNKLHPWCSRKVQFLSSPHKQSGTWDYCLGVCFQSFCFKTPTEIRSWSSFIDNTYYTGHTWKCKLRNSWPNCPKEITISYAVFHGSYEHALRNDWDP